MIESIKLREMGTACDWVERKKQTLVIIFFRSIQIPVM